jgi:hypothetical protein
VKPMAQRISIKATRPTPAQLELPGVYSIYNDTADRVYVGSSFKIGRRFHLHRRDLEAGRHHNPMLQEDWQAGHVFAWSIHSVYIGNPQSLLCDEQHMIDLMRASGLHVYNTVNACSCAMCLRYKDGISLNLAGEWIKAGRHRSDWEDATDPGNRILIAELAEAGSREIENLTALAEQYGSVAAAPFVIRDRIAVAYAETARYRSMLRHTHASH